MPYASGGGEGQASPGAPHTQSVCDALPGESTREVLVLQPYQAAMTPRELGGRLRLGTACAWALFFAFVVFIEKPTAPENGTHHTHLLNYKPCM